MDADQSLLEIKQLKTYFFLDEGIIRAVDGASFSIQQGQVLGVVGESGCGKSITARSILRIVHAPGKIVDGQILYHRRAQVTASSALTEVIDLTTLDPRGTEMRAIRGAEIAMVFQEPMTSLSPVHTIGTQIMEAITLHQRCTKAEARERTIAILGLVGMPKPSQAVDSYPHQLSGGMRQRAMIAMALSCHPSLLIADEPTTALDVTTEAQILDLMRRLQHQAAMAIMYITHNLGVVAEMSKDVIVMYLGKVMEAADVDTLFYDPQHPYTRLLLGSIPRIGRKNRGRLEVIKGMVPDQYHIPRGCPFHPRCPDRKPGICDHERPELRLLRPGHQMACHLSR